MSYRQRERNNDLRSHLKRLIERKDRRGLSLDFLMRLFEKQRGLCALSGIPMTWAIHAGRVLTNASIDRISSFGAYTENNVQLVCRIVNMMKNNQAQSEFIEVCRKIVEVNDAGRE